HGGEGHAHAESTEPLAGGGGGDGGDAIEADARPLESAFFQHAARRRVAHTRAARHHVVTEVLKGVIDHRAHGFGGVALAPEWNAEPIADLGWFLAELGDPPTPDHRAAP